MIRMVVVGVSLLLISIGSYAIKRLFFSPVIVVCSGGVFLKHNAMTSGRGNRIYFCSRNPSAWTNQDKQRVHECLDDVGSRCVFTKLLEKVWTDTEMKECVAVVCAEMDRGYSNKEVGRRIVSGKGGYSKLKHLLKKAVLSVHELIDQHSAIIFCLARFSKEAFAEEKKQAEAGECPFELFDTSVVNQTLLPDIKLAECLKKGKSVEAVFAELCDNIDTRLKPVVISLERDNKAIEAVRNNWLVRWATINRDV